MDPTADPTSDPTTDPTSDPTMDPTTAAPTTDPTSDPTIDPTMDPTTDPTFEPTFDPTSDPFNDPTTDPSLDPTRDPTVDPSIQPTTDPTINPTLSPTFCNQATYFSRKFGGNYNVHDSYGNLKYIDDNYVILFGGESIISLNCVFLLKLEFSANLIFKNVETNKIIWRTNISLINEYKNDGPDRDNIKFVMANNSLIIVEDKYPNNPNSKANILWREDLSENISQRRRLQQQDDSDNFFDIQLIINDNGYFIFYQIENELIPIWSSQEITTTRHSIITADDDSGSAEDDNLDSNEINDGFK